MTWNHRVIAKEYKGELTFGIHEVYYEDGVPNMCTENAVDVVGDNLAELAQTLRWMRKALRQPILSYSDFEEGGKYYGVRSECNDLPGLQCTCTHSTFGGIHDRDCPWFDVYESWRKEK